MENSSAAEIGIGAWSHQTDWNENRWVRDCRSVATGGNGRANGERNHPQWSHYIDRADPYLPLVSLVDPS
ncbi:MAG: hypothetical protein Q7T57_08170, partial [Dehalococcoidales bacterium]|nr:hypothetical protein [Dehalococcoidales bacterium]